MLLKLESLQRTGSFKIRGRLQPARAARRQRNASAGVVAFSSGNHAQGVAAAARMLGIRGHDRDALRRAAPQAREHARARRRGRALRPLPRKPRGRSRRASWPSAAATLVPAFDDPHIVAGQGTAGLELMQQAMANSGLTPDQVLIRRSGGGLARRFARSRSARCRHRTAVYGVEPDAFDDTRRSLAAGPLLENPPEARSICDALHVLAAGRDSPSRIIASMLAGILAVSDEEVRAAMEYGSGILKLVIEPGGAVALAARAGRQAPARRPHDGHPRHRRQCRRGHFRRGASPVASPRGTRLRRSRANTRRPTTTRPFDRDQPLDDRGPVSQLVDRRAGRWRASPLVRPRPPSSRDGRPPAGCDRRSPSGWATGSVDGRCSSSMVASIAPQDECPSTTTSRVPKRSAANSTLPISDGATMLPATRITNRSPGPLVEHDLDRHARIRAAEHDRERLLRRSRAPRARAALDERPVAADVGGEACIALAQPRQRVRCRHAATHGLISERSCAMNARMNAVRRSASRRPAGVCIVPASFSSLA